MTGRERSVGADGRTTAERGADHAAIDRLTDELLPALVARLGTTGLGELEVREGSWRVRLRRPPGADRPVPRSGRAAGRGSGRTAEGGPGREGPAAPSTPAGQAEDPSDGDPDAALPALTSLPEAGPSPRPGPLVATSPAVGVYRARGLATGARVRAGDQLGAVDLLGVAVEVAAPADGIVAALLVEDGDAVEYGQPIAALEPGAAGRGEPT